MRYWVVPGCLMGMIGALMAVTLPLPQIFWLVWLGIAVVGVGINVLSRTQLRALPLFMCLLALMVGGSWAHWRQFTPGPHDISRWADRPDAHVTGTLMAQGNNPGQWVVAIQTLEQHACNGQVLARFAEAEATALEVGDTVTLSGRLTLPWSGLYPGDFNYQSYLQRQQITALFKVRSMGVINTQTHVPWLQLLRFTNRMRDRITSNFKQALPNGPGELLASIVLGDHAVGLDQQTKTAFIRSGLIHTLAASGMNVGLIALFFLLIGTVLRLPRPWQLGLAMVGIGFYCILTGLPPSVQRAGLMLELAMLLKLFNRQLTPVVLLCITGVILIAIAPAQVTLLGFQLSFLSTFGLLTMTRWLQEQWGIYITRWGAGLLGVPLIAQLWVTPILLGTFGQVQWLSLPANLVALPLVAGLTYAGFALGFLSLISAPAAQVLLAGLRLPCLWLQDIATFFAAIGGNYQHVAIPTWPSITLMYVALFALAALLEFPISWRPKSIVVAITSLGIMLLLPSSITKWQQQSVTELAWLPTGSGPGNQVLRVGTQTVLVNATRLNRFDSRSLQGYLQRQGIAHIDVLNLPAANLRNVSGLGDLAGNLTVGQIIISPQVHAPAVQVALTDFAETHVIPIIPLSGTQILSNSEVHMRLFALPGHQWQRIKLGSDCLILHWGEPLSAASPLATLTQACTLTLDEDFQQRTVLRSLILSNPIPLSGFTKIEISPHRIRVYNGETG